MKIKRIVVTVVAITAIVLLLITLARAYFEEVTTVMAKVTVTNEYLDTQVAKALETVCMDGTFMSITGLHDIGVPESDRGSYLIGSKFGRKDVHTVYVTALLPAIYVDILWRSTAVPEGASLTYEYLCTVEKAFSSRLTESTVPKKYLRKRFRP